MEHGAAGQAPLVVACCLWVGRAQLAPAASLGHMGYRLGLPGGLEPEPVPHCPVPSQSLIWGFSVSGWTGGLLPCQCLEHIQGDVWGEDRLLVQAGRTQTVTKEGHVPILNKRKPAFLDTSR